MNHNLHAMVAAVLEGDRAGVEAEVQKALGMGVAPRQVLENGLVGAMRVVGERFECGEIYVPEMLVSARAMQAGLALVKPSLVNEGVKLAGLAVIGTVEGDMHDIGKNLVGMMLEGAGFEVVDLGVDVSADRFTAAVMEYRPQILGLSALLTTTMLRMRDTVEALEKSGLRRSVKVIVGGAPVTTEYAAEIGADGTAPDASRAVTLVKSLIDPE